MGVSLSETADLTCPQCGKSSTAEIWLIVDSSARPDLVTCVYINNLARHKVFYGFL